ncbi:MAG TPA: secretin N-terminal domain-containing protein [Pyrinomonadaceae bacterium]|nr:secretin N-terminal domain-containing protein [Pyrinomonadaceae bacterium]
MKLQNRWHSVVALVVVVGLLALPVSALGKKGKEHYDRGMKFEEAQQWEKAAQEFTLAIAADPHKVDYQLHYRRAVFNASQSFMQQGRSLAEQRDYVGAYNAFRQAFGYDPVNQLAVSEMERMLRLQEVKEGRTPSTAGGDAGATPGTGATPPGSSTTRPQEALPAPKQEQVRVITYNGDLKPFIRTLADDLKLNVMFDKQTFAQPRPIDINLHDVTTARALDYIFLQEGLFFQKLDKRTILVADQGRRQQFQQLVVRTFYLSNTDPDSASALIGRALPASVGRPQAIVVPDKYTNSLTVRDTAENIALIGDLLRSIDKDRAEVVMDVDIYEVNRSALLQFGNQMGSGAFTLGGSPGLAILSNNGVTTGRQAGINLSSVVGLTPTGAAAALVLPPSVFNAFQSRNNAKLLASTQIHAFNNEESTARIGQRVPVQTAQAFPFGVQTGTTTTPTANQPFGSGGFPVINYEPTGLTLSFTPQVFPNLDVQVKMKIESKDVSGANSLTPTFTERTISGTARVQNNRTMMLASVSTEVQSNGRQGLPVLGGLPILGRFFTAPTKENRQVDIVISVTPRVLRAPAVTPRDEEMRQSGTLQSPTTGSIATLMSEAERDEQIAAARQIPKEVAVQLPDAPPTYAPATKVADQTANSAANSSAAQVTAVSQNDYAAPAPKTAAFTASGEQPKTLDVASAIKNIVAPGTGVSASSASAKTDATAALVVEQLSPKSEKSGALVKSIDATASVTELRLVSEKGELRVGEKQQLTVQFKSDAPFGLAVLTMRFDPNVIKIKSVSAGSIFATAKAAPTIMQSIDEHGMMLVSLAPAAGSAVSGEGALLTFEVEAIGTGDSALAFDLANVHLVASDGRNVVLQLEPIKLTVKQ